MFKKQENTPIHDLWGKKTFWCQTIWCVEFNIESPYFSCLCIVRLVGSPLGHGHFEVLSQILHHWVSYSNTFRFLVLNYTTVALSFWKGRSLANWNRFSLGIALYLAPSCPAPWLADENYPHTTATMLHCADDRGMMSCVVRVRGPFSKCLLTNSKWEFISHFFNTGFLLSTIR